VDEREHARKSSLVDLLHRRAVAREHVHAGREDGVLEVARRLDLRDERLELAEIGARAGEEQDLLLLSHATSLHLSCAFFSSARRARRPRTFSKSAARISPVPGRFTHTSSIVSGSPSPTSLMATTEA